MPALTEPGQMALCSVRSACHDPALFERPAEHLRVQV